MSIKFGLIGTITHDFITYDSGRSFEGLGGVLYQAAVLCGLGKEVCLYTNLGEDLVQDVEALTKNWTTFHRNGICHIPGPGNQVYLQYPAQGERIEVLKSIVPPLDPGSVIKDIDELGMLILVINSGFDIRLADWRKIVRTISCPIWVDIHSLLLSRELNVPRRYLHLAEWKEWVEGAAFIQANAKEVASMLGDPDKMPSEFELVDFGEIAFELGARAVFVTLGEEGVLVLTPKKAKKIAASEAEKVVDTTGCGDVFCSATAFKLAEGDDAFEAASYGLVLATKAVSVSGIEETYLLACRSRKSD